MILWLAETLILGDQAEIRFEAGPDYSFSFNSHTSLWFCGEPRGLAVLFTSYFFLNCATCSFMLLAAK